MADFVLPSPLCFQELNPATAADPVLRAIARHDAALYRERLPADPPLHEPTQLASLRQVGGSAARHYFLLWDEEIVIASASLELPAHQNTDVAFCYVSVLPPYRRQGLGRYLLDRVKACARPRARARLLTNASSLLPAGLRALPRVGATLVMEQQFMQLDLAALEPGLLARWQREAATDDYRCWQNLGPYPAERLADIAALHNVMNTAPQGTRDLQGWQILPATLREQEQELRASGTQCLTSFIEHRPSGQLVAYSEMFWPEQRASLLNQRATAVHPAHRRRHLGRWLKAANLQAALATNPAARYVRAGNTPDNVGMLRLNQALGFVTYATHTDWQLATEPG